jgi:hypothetical protein
VLGGAAIDARGVRMQPFEGVGGRPRLRRTRRTAFMGASLHWGKPPGTGMGMRGNLLCWRPQL